MQEMFN